MKKTDNFNKNVLKLMTGTTLAQAIPIAISPILTRLYTPNDFGVLALFLAITTVLGVIVNGRYELAIVLPEKDEEAINIIALSVIVAMAFSLAVFIIIILFKSKIVLLSTRELGIWLYFIPVVIFFVGLYNALNQLNIRLKTYGLLARVKIIKSLSQTITQLLFGFFNLGLHGLIGGNVVSHMFTNYSLAKKTMKNKNLISKINIKDIKTVALKYKKFPMITMWGTLLNVLTVQITNFFVSFIYGLFTLGHYSLVQRTISLPTSIIGQSIGDVYFQSASKAKSQSKAVENIYNSTLKKLLILGIPMFSVLYLVAEDLIAFVFSEEWRIAGTYTKILIPLFFIRFIVSPLSVTTIIFNKQIVDLYWQIVLLILSVIVFSVTFMFDLEVNLFLKLYSWILFLHYIILLYITKKISKGG